MRVQGKSGAHEYIQDIVYMAFGKSISQTLTSQVGMTTHMALFARHEFVGVRIAARPNHVVDAGAVLIKSVGNGIVRNGRQRSEVGHVGP